MAVPLSWRSAVVVLALAGAAASAGVVVGATGAGPIDGVVTPAGPLGLWSAASTGRGWYAGLAVVSLGALAMLFVQVYQRTAAGRLGVRAVGVVAAVWCVPVLPAAPLLSLDVYSYAAQGSMVLAGLDPYVAGPDRLGGPLLQSVAPVWRDTPAPYGPLSLALLARLAALTGGQPVLFVYGLRFVALLGVLGAAVAVLRLAEPERRAAALALVAANPLVVLHLIGGRAA